MEERKSAYPIEPIILNRWSPRAMSGDTITDEELMPLFEAARWAPSSYNAQPWRFIFAKRGDENWDRLFALLVPANQGWVKNAGVLVVLVSHKVFERNGKPSITHSFDAGAAWENLALQGTKNGLVVHGMQGFDYERAKTDLQIPDDYSVEMMIAIGKKGNPDSLPEEMRAKEMPNDRKPLDELLMKGVFT